MSARSTFALFALLSLPVSTAAAQGTIAPPGNSAIQEYQEQIPSLQGGSRPGSGDGGSGSGGTVLTPAERRALASQGADGVRAAQLADVGAPATSSSKGTGTGGSQGTSNGAGPGGTGGAGTGNGAAGNGGGNSFSSDSSAAGSPVAAVVDRGFLGSSGGMGIVLPLLLLATGAAGVVVMLRARRPTR